MWEKIKTGFADWWMGVELRWHARMRNVKTTWEALDKDQKELMYMAMAILVVATVGIFVNIIGDLLLLLVIVALVWNMLEELNFFIKFGKSDKEE